MYIVTEYLIFRVCGIFNILRNVVLSDEFIGLFTPRQ